TSAIAPGWSTCLSIVGTSLTLRMRGLRRWINTPAWKAGHKKSRKFRSRSPAGERSAAQLLRAILTDWWPAVGSLENRDDGPDDQTDDGDDSGEPTVQGDDSVVHGRLVFHDHAAGRRHLKHDGAPDRSDHRHDDRTLDYVEAKRCTPDETDDGAEEAD